MLKVFEEGKVRNPRHRRHRDHRRVCGCDYFEDVMLRREEGSPTVLFDAMSPVAGSSPFVHHSDAFNHDASTENPTPSFFPIDGLCYSPVEFVNAARDFRTPRLLDI